MKKTSLTALAGALVLCFGISVAGASTANVSHLPGTPSGSHVSHLVATQHGNHPTSNDVTSTVPFPTAGDAFCGSNFCGNIPAGGQTDYMFTAGDYVISSVFSIPTNSVTDLTANWIFQDFLGVSTENFNVLVNGVSVATAALAPCGECGLYFTVTGTVNFADIAPVNGGYQIELVELNSIPPGDGSIAWADGGTTGLSYGGTPIPEPSSIMLFGSGLLGLAGALRRKLL